MTETGTPEPGTPGAGTPRARLPLATGRQVLRALRRAVGAQRLLAMATLLLAAAAALAGLVAPWAIGLLVDEVVGGGEPGGVVALIAWVAGAGVLGAALTAVSAAAVARIGQRVLARMREDVLGAALRLPPGRLEETGRGDLLARVGDDVGVVSQVVASLLAPWVGAALAVTLTVAGLFALNPLLALAGLTAIPVYVLALRWYLPRAAPRYGAERAAFGDRSEALVASLSGLPTVHAYGAEREHAAEIAASSHRARTISRDVLWFATGWGKWMNIAELVGLGAIIAAGFGLVRADAVTVGAVTAAALYFHRLFNPLGLIVFSFDEMQSAGASLQRMVGVVIAGAGPGAGAGSGADDAPGARPPSPAGSGADAGAGTGHSLPGLPAADRPAAADHAPAADRLPADARPAGAVSVRGVGHRYGEHRVLREVSLEIAPGEQVALVGASGAGKSTLALILAGLTDPAEGAVRVDGVPPAGLAAAGRRPVVLVSQESHVFSGPLAEDLRLARADATDEEVHGALRLVGADGWARALPEGIHTAVGDVGHTLTAEQGAQVALARAALADPAVLVLDEATAESGSRGAARLEEAAAAVLAGRTGLVVAHRMNQASRADRVLVVAEGRIVEEGPHADLLAAGGLYARLWEAYDDGR